MFAAMVLHKHNKQNNGNNSNNHHHHHHHQQHHNNHHTRNNNTSGTSNNLNNNHINNNVGNVNQTFGTRTIEWFLCLKPPFNIAYPEIDRDLSHCLRGSLFVILFCVTEVMLGQSMNPAVIRPIMLNARLTPAIGEINVRQIGCPIAWLFRFCKHHVASKTWPMFRLKLSRLPSYFSPMGKVTET
ncbi:LOW QUALITY PROTEIN: hypothetical protein V1478_011921 [Vespula squamosa]|uniref:Uncharacterized protein n=1 Tax=Vespula squamosa TaxID=30214 RepID=A0ABD2ADY0_VESSQ